MTRFSVLMLVGAGAFATSDAGGKPRNVHAHAGDCAHEPELPPLLEVTPNASDPDQVTVRVLGGVSGQAKLTVESPATVEWENAPATNGMRLKKGDAARRYGLRLGPKTKGIERKVKVSLVIEDEAGRPAISVQREVNLDGASQKAATESRPSVEVSGTSALGSAVTASVPLNAPVPVVAGVTR